MRAIKILERVSYTIPIMFGVAVIVFIFIRMTPGDPVDIMMGQGGPILALWRRNLAEFLTDLIHHPIALVGGVIVILLILAGLVTVNGFGATTFLLG